MKKINARSLSFKLVVGACLLTVIPLIIIGWISITKSSSALLHIGHDNLKEAAHEMAALVETNLELQIEMAALFSTGEHIVKVLENVHDNGIEQSSEDMASLRVELKKAFKALDEHFLGIFVTDSTGLALTGELADGTEYKGFSVGDMGYFQKAKKTGHTVAGDMARSKKTGGLIYVISAPVLSDENEFLGIFGISVKAHFLVDIVSGTKHGETGYGWMINSHGINISHPNEDNILNLDMKTLAGMENIIKHMLDNGHGVEDYVFKGVHKIAGYAHIPAHDWSLAVTQDEDEFQSVPRSIRNILFIVGGILLGLAVPGVLLFTRGITLPINRITDGLSQGADQVADASGQVSSSSQSMAEGASEQAASIEETSSSMEEMASMTKKNAENASHADGLMKEANSVVKEANSSMNDLTASMEDISKASEETSKIIKTIDEIAFQTNLLALNAAVEAARAGEAGAGFAVVADEVRNLAMRAADAAKDTSQLIEGTVKKVNDGSELVETTNQAFIKVAESATKVGELVEEISEASKEQSEGIEQVNNAITEMDKVVQQNAANAEESAAASEEMNAQAEQLREYVDDLITLITGEKAQAKTRTPQNTGMVVSQASSLSTVDPKKSLVQKTKKVQPDQIIPLDDDDFKDF